MTLSPRISLSFDGRCEAVFRFYARCLDGTISFMLTYGDSPMQSPAPGWEKKIANATLQIGDTAFAGADLPLDQYERPQGSQVLLNLDDPAEAERIFHAPAEHGRVDMPLQETFWAARFGVLVDQFGIPWSINCGPGGDKTA